MRFSHELGTLLFFTSIILPQGSSGLPANYQDYTKVVKSGSEYILPCSTDDNVKYDAIWWSAGHELNSKSVNISVRTKSIKMMLPKSTKYQMLSDNSLLIANTTRDDSGVYKCSAKQSSGATDEHYYTILFQVYKPNAPMDIRVSNVRSRVFKISWSFPSKSKDRASMPLEFIIYVRNLETNMITEKRVPNNQTWFYADDLSPFTKYEVTVQSWNVVGVSRNNTYARHVETKQEKPSGKPINLSVIAASATQLQITWENPSQQFIHGVLLGVYISYRREVDINYWTRSSKLSAPIIIDGLQPYTTYYVKLQLYNAAGKGPFSAEVKEKTFEGVPDPPLDVRVADVTKTSLFLMWKKCPRPSGVLLGYKIYIESGERRFKVIKVKDTDTSIWITHLDPYVKYGIRMSSYNKANESLPTSLLENYTDVSGASAPRNVTAIEISAGEGSVLVEWLPPLYINKSIDYYRICYRELNAENFLMVEPVLARRKNNKCLIKDRLLSGVQYELWVIAITKSILPHKKPVSGKASKHVQFAVKRGVGHVLQHDDISTGEQESEEMSGMVPLFAGIFGGILAIIMAIFAAVLWRRKYYERGFYYGLATPANKGQIPDAWTLHALKMDFNSGAIRIADFEEHHRMMSKNENKYFKTEFDSISNASSRHFTPTTLHRHKQVARCESSIVYDNKRVRIKSANQDYLNASYVDGYHLMKAFIASQGPTSSTVIDFWQMIWEQKTSTIVMLTNCIENGRRKSVQYWPNNCGEREKFGFITVTLKSSKIRAFYTVRHFIIANCRLKRLNERSLHQYHYTDWPGDGVPRHPITLLEFANIATLSETDQSGPVIVHCSGGVGRTCTYIAIDVMLRMIADQGAVNIPGFIRHLRSQRANAVQTEEQYKFIYDVMLEAKLSLCKMYATFDMMSHNINNAELERQFKEIENSFYHQDLISIAALPSNEIKNRSSEILPSDHNRVYNEDISVYINASYLPGFHSSKEYIVTQYPTTATMADLWTMIWNQNCSCIVLLYDPYTDEHKEPDEPIFWPIHKSKLEFGQFSVSRLSTFIHMNEDKHTFFEFLLESKQDDFMLEVKMHMCKEWPCTTDPLLSIFDLPNVVHDRRKDFSTPITVIDRYGGATAGMFCVLSTLKLQIFESEVLDIYKLFKIYLSCRPGMFTKRDYSFAFHVMASFADNYRRKKPMINFTNKNKLMLKAKLSKNSSRPISITANNAVSSIL